jgi:hypothetical protein
VSRTVNKADQSLVPELIKLKKRVADHGEVFTPAWMVEAMLDLVKGGDDNRWQTLKIYRVMQLYRRAQARPIAPMVVYDPR